MSLRCLALDSEKSALAELSYLLDNDPRIGQVVPISDAHQASAALQQAKIDAVFVCLIHHSVEQVNELLAPFASHTKFVALSKRAEDAVNAFEFGAIDYILKPINRQSIDRAITRLENHFNIAATTSNVRIKVEHNGVTYYLQSNEVLFARAQGDFSIVTTVRGEFLAKASLAKLSNDLAEAGFERVHRQWLVNLSHVQALMNQTGCTSLQVVDQVIPVSRRCARIVKQKLA